MKELPKKPASNHKVQLALNWTASSEEVLNALHNSYKVEDVGDEKVVLIQVVSFIDSYSVEVCGVPTRCSAEVGSGSLYPVWSWV